MKHLMVMSLACLAAPAGGPPSELALNGLDPVELAQGREVEGSEELELDHRLFRYRFASAANRERFARDPEERGIQFDGACGKMGPPGGVCSPDRWLVHEGRIYLFASDSCRSSFARDPGRFLVDADPEPQGDARITHRFSRFRDVGGGLVLPLREERSIDGRALAGYEAGTPAIEPDAALPADAFDLPE